MKVLVLLDSDDAENARLAQDRFGDNLIFDNEVSADEWCCRNAGRGTAVQFIEINEE